MKMMSISLPSDLSLDVIDSGGVFVTRDVDTKDSLASATYQARKIHHFFL
jgi:hypothetical protein